MTSIYLDSSGCEDNKVSIYKVGKIAGKVLLISVLIGSSAMPAFAIEPVKAVVTEAPAVSKTSLAITCAICTLAGSLCTKAAEKAVQTDPKFGAVIGCVALMSWCAAKASPL
jgi:chromate transport protein ChrA